MGQSLSRRPTPAPTSSSASTPISEPTGDAPRRSLPRRIFSSLPKPSLKSRTVLSSLTLPNQPEQTLKGKKRRWGFSRRQNPPVGIERAIPEHLDPLAEHDGHQVDRDVDEFGVITHRVPDSHTDSRATSAKGKERAKDVSDIDDDDEPASSSSAVSLPIQPGPRTHHIDDDQAVVPPPVPLSPLSQDSERLSITPPALTLPTISHSPVQPTNTSPRPFPPPGTLVVVQGVVHTTDTPRSSERPIAASNPTPPTLNDATGSNVNSSLDTGSIRPSSLPPGTRLRNNPLSGVLPRPSSMVPNMFSTPSSEPMTDSSMIDSQQATSNIDNTDDGEFEDATHLHPHGISAAQSPLGTSGLSASSIDVLGTLLSVAAAATAASLLTGSSEPIFSSGLTSSQPPPPSGSTPQSMGFNSNVPSERPLSPTPTSDAGRMRHVWSSLRDRLGLGSGSHNSNLPNDIISNPGMDQNTPSQPSDFIRPRDPREIMLAEMARAFNLGLGLGGATTGTPAVTSQAPEGVIPDTNDVPARDIEREPPSPPPPDSFERFLMDLQSDLRVTLMHEQDSNILGRFPQDLDESAQEQPMPELQSLSDSDSEEFESRHPNSGDEEELDCEEDLEEDADADEEDVHTAQEQLSGRTSPAVSALGTGTGSPFGVKTTARPTSSYDTAGTSLHHTAPSQPISATARLSAEVEYGTNKPAMDNDNGEETCVTTGISSCSSEIQPEDVAGHHQDQAVLGVAHSPGASNGGRRVEAEGGPAVSGAITIAPHDALNSSNVPETDTRRETCFSGTSSLSTPLTSNSPNSSLGESATTSNTTQPSTWASPLPLDPEPTSQNSSSANPVPVDSSMPFRLPFTSSSASRTEHTPGGGINWWRMYRFPAVASPNLGQLGGPQGLSPPSPPPLHGPTQGPSHTSSWARSADQNQQNETITPRGVAEVPGVHSGLAAPVLTHSLSTPARMAELVSAPDPSTNTTLPANGQAFESSTNAASPPEHRSNVVVPVIVVGLQSVNMDRQPPHASYPPTNRVPSADDEDNEGMDFDGLEQTMSMPLHIPEPAEFRRHPSSSNTTQQEQGNQQPARGRTWHSRAANAIRNLRPSRRNADTTSPQPQETPGSRTFLIYVIGGYYPPDHQIITGGNLDSFEALWELAELLGQVKPPTASKEEIERSGLEIIKASVLPEYEEEGRVANNCIDRCLICLDDYNPEDELRVLTCKHAFHQGCVDRWLETGRNNCPACRTQGVANQDA